MKPKLMVLAGIFVLAGTLLTVDAAQRKRPRRKRNGEINTPPARGERQRDKLNVGDMAPDFTLPDISGKKNITLSSFRGKKPVVLIFASCT